MDVDQQVEEALIQPSPSSSEQAEAIEASKDGVESFPCEYKWYRRAGSGYRSSFKH